MFSRGTAMVKQTVDANRDPVALIPQLKDPDPNLRAEAARNLKQFMAQSDVVVPALVDALSDEDRNVRFSAIISLENLGTYARSAIPALKRIVDEHPDIALRFVASSVLETLDQTREIAMFEHAIVRMPVDARKALLNALWDLDPDPTWREQVALWRTKYVSDTSE
jgi:HEAT repeat protein